MGKSIVALIIFASCIAMLGMVSATTVSAPATVAAQYAPVNEITVTTAPPETWTLELGDNQEEFKIHVKTNSKSWAVSASDTNTDQATHGKLRDTTQTPTQPLANYLYLNDAALGDGSPTPISVTIAGGTAGVDTDYPQTLKQTVDPADIAGNYGMTISYTLTF